LSFVGNCEDMAMLFLHYGWMVSLSNFHSRWRSDCEQDLYDQSGRRKHRSTTLFGKASSQNNLLF
jgi:hypothetical protein